MDLNARRAGGRTPLHVAAVEADLAAVELLLAAGADAALRTPTDARATAEEAARTLGHTASADLIAAWHVGASGFHRSMDRPASIA